MAQLKFFKRLNLYKNASGNANLIYNPFNRIALSYGWYEIYKVINNKRVLNTFSYSVTTSKHVNILRQFFNHCRDEILFIEAPQGLQNLDASIKLYEKRISQLQALIDKPKTRKSTNEKRLDQIFFYRKKINQVRQLQGVN